MADTRFFNNTGALSLKTLCDLTGASTENVSLNKEITDVAPLQTANENQISFFDNAKYKDLLKKTKAGAVLMSKEALKYVPDNVQPILVEAPYKAYALVAQAFYPLKRKLTPYKASSAIISSKAKVHEDTEIHDNVVVGDGAEIGEGTIIEANTIIGKGVVIGQNCRVESNVTLSHCIIGNSTRIYPGCRIGQDGFGFAIDPAGFVKVPQLGRVVIGSHCEIGANTCIDRGAGPDTEIGSGTWIDNLVQIGHNVKIGKGCVIVSQVGIAGSTELGNYVVLGGQVGIAGHLKIGDGAQVGAKAGVMGDVPAGETYLGAPAMPRLEFMKQVAYLRKMLKKKD